MTTAPSPDLAGSRRIHRAALATLLLLVASFSFLDYHTYVQEAAEHPGHLAQLLAGSGLAPEQYRIAIPKLAQALHHLLHLPYEVLFALIDFLTGLAASLAIYRSLTLQPTFSRVPPAHRLVRIAILTTLLTFYLSWAFRYQRPDTLPGALFVSLAALLLASGYSLALPALVLLSLVQGFIRADVATTFNVGLFLYAAVGLPLPGTLRRIPTLLASALGVLLSIGVLFFFAHVVYPHANYGTTAVVQLRNNLSGQLFPFLLFLTPLLVGFRLSLRSPAPDPNRYLYLSAGLFLVSWFVLGRAQEVRIFLPFAIALIPLASTTLAQFLLAEPPPQP